VGVSKLPHPLMKKPQSVKESFMAYRAVTSFAVGVKDRKRSRVIGEGTVLSDDDPAVKKYKKYPHLLEPLEDHLRSVEEAAAVPGVKRDLDVEIPSSLAAKKKGKK
jgi:hypothetical protein